MIKLILLLSLLALIVIRCSDNSSLKEQKSVSKNQLELNDFNLKIDSEYVELFYKTYTISDSIQKEVNQFYRKRSHKMAWINKQGLIDGVYIFYNQLQNYQYNFADNSFYNRELDSVIIASKQNEGILVTNGNTLYKIDLLLTSTFFRYAKKAYGGKANNLQNLEWFIPREIKNYQSTLDSLVTISKKVNEQIPLNKNYFLLKKQLKKYRDIEKMGGLPYISMYKKTLDLRSVDSSIQPIKQYLYLTSDLKINDGTNVFNDSLQKAITHFQRRMGLTINGNIDSLTIEELRKSVATRIKQIIINMERLRWLPVTMETNYLLINIPEFKLQVVQNSEPVWETNIVVGKSATQTSIFKSNVSQIILNPYWGVPQSIANKEILNHLKKDANYLQRNNMEVLSRNKVINHHAINWNSYHSHVPFTFRQRPGKNNALGKIKFIFPNTYDIYLHDTPTKQLFDDTQRAFSHGCIRVSDPKELAMYLLGDSSSWNTQKINKILKTDKETVIKLKTPTPIYIVYFTSWVDNLGQLQFRNDVYGLDEKLSIEIFGEK